MVSTLKATMGFMILQAGAGVIVSSIAHFNDMFSALVNVNGAIPHNELIIGTIMKDFGNQATFGDTDFGLLTVILNPIFSLFS